MQSNHLRRSTIRYFSALLALFLVAPLHADVLDQCDAGIVGLHHDVEQGQRDVGVARQQVARLCGRVGAQQFDFAALEREAGEDQA